MKLFRSSLIILGIVLLSGCGLVPSPDNDLDSNPTPTTNAGLAVEPSPTADAARPQTLHIWLPAQFDPEADNPAALLLKERLSEFTQHHPGVRIEIRLKPASGPGGLLEYLSASASAAPASLPDLVLFTRQDLEQAAKRNLVHPLDNTWDGRLDEDWYPFALELGTVSSQTYGIPFAADALILAYDEESLPEPPQSWLQVIESGITMSLPPADPQALITASYYFYESELIDPSYSSPSLHTAALASVFEYYSAGNDAGVFPIWLTQLDSDQSAWQALSTGQADMGITWMSTFALRSDQSFAASLIPTSDGQPFAPARSWSWALAGLNLNRQSLALELAEFLTENEFLSAWTAAAGYIPPRAGALALWSDGHMKSLAGRVVPAARMIPSIDIIESFGTIFSQLAIEVIKGDVDAETAAQSAAEALQNN